MTITNFLSNNDWFYDDIWYSDYQIDKTVQCWCSVDRHDLIVRFLLCPRPVRAEALSDAFVWRLSDVRLTSVAYIGNSSRTERPRKTKVGTQVAHVTRDSDTTFKIKRSKFKVTRPVYSPRRLRTGSCSGQRGNVLSVGDCCYVAVCRRGGRLGGARRYGAHTGEGRGHIVSPRAQLVKVNRLRRSCTVRKSAMSYIISYCLCFFKRILAAVVDCSHLAVN